MSEHNQAVPTPAQAMQILTAISCNCYPILTGPVDYRQHQKVCRYRITAEAIINFHRDRMDVHTEPPANTVIPSESAHITLDKQILCVRREIAMRKNVYKRRVDSGAMSQAEADRELTTMIAVHTSLMKLKAIGIEDTISAEEEAALRKL